MISDEFEIFSDNRFCRGQTKNKISVQKIIHFIKIKIIQSKQIYFLKIQIIHPEYSLKKMLIF